MLVAAFLEQIDTAVLDERDEDMGDQPRAIACSTS